MARKFLMVGFFLVVFGLPVCWYLFLQTFGENKFDLPKLYTWDQQCLVIDQPAMVVRKPATLQAPNEWARISLAMNSQAVIQTVEMSEDSCGLQLDAFLIDGDGWVRGEFELTREDVDRLLAELDIYLLNINNGTEN